MRWLRVLASAFVALLAAVPGRANELPGLDEILARADAKCLELWDGFRQFVAEERDVQQVFSKSGKIQRERRINADYFIVRVPSAEPGDPEGLLEFRDVLEVDGKRLRRRQEQVLELLTTPGAGVVDEQCRILSAANQHNLMWGSHMLISFTAGLAGYIHHQPKVATTFRLSPEAARNADEVVVWFEEGPQASRAQQGDCRKPRPLPATGRVHLARADFSVVRVEVNTTVGEGPIRLRMITEYRNGPGGLRVPERRVFEVLHPKWRSGVAGRAEATYSNFRRFTTDSTIAFEPIR